MNSYDRYEARQLQKARQREIYRRDFETFAREQIKIRGIQPGQILNLDINTRPAQFLLHQKCQAQLKEKGYIRGRGVKCRQQGWSTYSECRMFHGAVLNRNFNTLLVGNDKETTETIFRIARFAYDSLRPDYRPLERYNSKRELLFENPDPRGRNINPGLSSRMTIIQAKELAGTGSTIQGLHTDETSKWPEAACTMLETTLLPALHLQPGTIHLDTSTAFARGMYFREKCDAARSGKTSYFFQFVPWWLDPTYSIPLSKGERFKPDAEEQRLIKLAAKGQPWPDDVPPMELTYPQLKWRRTVITDRTDGERLFAQEYPHTYEDAWVTMDLNVFNLDALRRQKPCLPLHYAVLKPSNMNNYDRSQVELRSPVENVIDPDEDYVAIWRLPERGHMYAMGIDVALGLEGGNWTVFEVFDFATREQVAEAHLHIDPDDAGWLAFTLGMFYNRAQINTELTGPGYNTDARLKKLYYPNLYIWRNRERIVPKLTSYTGWKTSPESKKFLIGMTRPLLNHDQVTLHSRLLLDELRHFVVVPGFIQDQYYAESGDDDAVLAMMFSLVVVFDEDYSDQSLMPQGSPPPTLPQLETIRDLGVAKSIEQADYMVDNYEPGDRMEDDPISRMIQQLRGWT